MNIQDLVIFKDPFIIALNKPSGIAVHKGPSNRECLEDYFDKLCYDLPRPPALAHRLDADTSGILVLGRHGKALKRLGEFFRNKRIEKTYLAIVEKTPEHPEGTIDLPIFKKNSKTKGWRIVIDKNFGQPSISHYKVLKTLEGGKALLELKPETGRTHQLRVHCQAMGWPIVGDSLYGTNSQHPADLLDSNKNQNNNKIENKPKLDNNRPKLLL
ncbi:MAG: RluA family pseudouridine synthase, partial [Rickettsiales bacterium]|nr:RluA family pseudouridine synthase [Rickettsiales bacterium]